MTCRQTCYFDKQTHLRCTEQAAYFDGLDTPADRERGTRAEFKRLDAALSGEFG